MFANNIEKSILRLSSPIYQIDNLFRAEDYDWPGDWEGRALLAFCRLYSITGKKIPAMDEMAALLPQKTNSDGFFGAKFDVCAVDEQQLSGHSWYLRGLVAYAELFPRSAAMDYARKTVHNLFIPALKQYENYPVERGETAGGGVSGNLNGKIGNWRLSTDVGCAFIPLDGLAHYYSNSRDEELKPLLEAAIEKFLSLDKVSLKMQTHATLTAARGILKYYEATADKKYLTYVIDTFRLYIQCGMTATYENYNWFGRSHEEIWTEPCAVVDSMILALELYQLTGEENYKKLARRIWFNGLQFCQRVNGGAGPNSCVDANRPMLKTGMYEAPFCCTMRYAEGLYWFDKNRDLLTWNDGEPVKEDDRYFINDWLLVEDTEGVFSGNKTYTTDSGELILLPGGQNIPEEKASDIRLKVIFR